jgi:hypothetical protein
MLGSDIVISTAGLPPLALDPANGQSTSDPGDPVAGAVAVIGQLGQLANSIGNASAQVGEAIDKANDKDKPAPPSVDPVVIAIAAVAGIALVVFLLNR